MSSAPFDAVEIAPVQPLTARQQPHRAGRIVLIAAIALALLSTVASVTFALLGAPYVDRSGGGFQFNFQFGDPRPTVSFLGAAGPLHVVVGSLIGTWVIVQSIVAIAADWGRVSGIAALIIAVVTPIMSFALFMGLLLTTG